MNLRCDIELVDIKPYQEKHPSPYWILLIANLIPKGFGKWESVDGELRAFLPKQAVEQLVESDWIKNPPATGEVGSVAMTYLMVDSRNSLVKIGRASNPKHRESTLQSEVPQIKLFAVCPNNIERALHSAYASSRVRGEWFRLTSEQVDQIISQHNFTRIPDSI